MNLSVLMAVYAGDRPGPFAEALQSLVAQTYKDFEVVIAIDGPISGELESVLSKFQGTLKLRLVRLEENLGLAEALNQGLKECHGEWVARMDSDDVALPERIETQVDFHAKNPEVDVSSAILEEWDDSLVEMRGVRDLPYSHHDILSFAKRRNPISHPCSFFRKAAVLKVGGYPNFRKAQDYALWSLMLHNGCIFANIPEVLLKMRCGGGLLDRRGFAYLKNELKILKFQREIGFINPFEWLVNVLLRSCVRLAPSGLKSLFYKVFR